MQTPIGVDRRRRVPLHRQIYDEWRKGILAGRFVPGERMPSTRDLAASLGVSRVTVTQAYEQLAVEGYLEGRRGSGTFVSRNLPDAAPGVPGRGPRRRSSPPARLSRFVGRLGPVPARSSVPPGVIDLSGAGPDLDAFPAAVWARLVRRHLRRPGGARWREGVEGPGFTPLREAVARYLRQSRAVDCVAGQVVIVSGSQQALDLCARVLIDPGDEVVVEDPGYPGARHLFAAAGACVPWPSTTMGSGWPSCRRGRVSPM